MLNMHNNVGEAAWWFSTLTAHWYWPGSIENTDSWAWPLLLHSLTWLVWGVVRASELKRSLDDSNVQPGLRITAVWWLSFTCLNLLVQWLENKLIHNCATVFLTISIKQAPNKGQRSLAYSEIIIALAMKELLWARNAISNLHHTLLP